MIGQTTRVARAIIEVLAPMTGSPAYGFALVKATAGDVLLPACSFAAPIQLSGVGTTPNQQIDRENLIRTTDDVVVNSAGVLVPIRSLLGGDRQNWPVDTELRWDPPLAGIEEVSKVALGPMAGGADATDPGAVKQVILYEELRGTAVGLDLFRATAERGAPCVIVTWNDSPGTTKMARDKTVAPDRWVVFVVVGHAAGGNERAGEGLDVMDRVTDLLGERGEIGGFVFSGVPASIQARRRVATSEFCYVYAVEVKTFGAWERTLSFETTVPAEWERTRYDLTSGREEPRKPVVDDAVYDMLLRGFDHGFLGVGFGGRDG